MRRVKKETRFNNKNRKGNHPTKAKQTQLKVSETTELMKFLQQQMPDKSRTTIKSILAHRQVSIDHQTVTQYNHPLQPGQLVVVNWGKIEETPKYQGLKIIYEDPDIIVINKNPGLLSISTDRERIKTAYGILNRHVKRNDPQNQIFLVHRLDREASGLMVFTKSQEAQKQLILENGQPAINQKFMAVVEGVVEKEKDIITSWLWESKAYVMHSTDVPGDGLEATTQYSLQKKNNKFSLLQIFPKTNRKNQIRVHMKEIGHSIVGDKKYGSNINPIRRVALHAQTLSFNHPLTGQEVHYDTGLPKKFSFLMAKSPKRHQ